MRGQSHCLLDQCGDQLSCLPNGHPDRVADHTLHLAGLADVINVGPAGECDVVIRGRVALFPPESVLLHGIVGLVLKPVEALHGRPQILGDLLRDLAAHFVQRCPRVAGCFPKNHHRVLRTRRVHDGAVVEM